MHNIPVNMKYKGLAMVLAIAAALTSCRTEKSPMEMFINIDEVTEPIEVGSYSLRIEPADELYITINSERPDASARFNLPAVNPAKKSDLGANTTPRQQTYIVDSNGFIDMPVIGKVHVAGMTREQLRDFVTEKVEQDVEDPHVYVEFVNFKVNVTGEVMKPGPIEVNSERFTVLDAIAAAGDLTQYGERNNVLLIREENGQRKHIRLNLNSAEVLSSPYFFLKQNDVIYVQPNKVRQDNSEYNQYNSYRLSVISTITGVTAQLVSLTIALTR